MARRLYRIQLRGGLKADMPTLSARECYFCEDTTELYIGTLGGTNIRISGGSNFNIRNGSVAIAAGVNNIGFTTPMSSVNYALSVVARGVDGSSIQTNETKQSTGFICIASDSGNLDYVAVENA